MSSSTSRAGEHSTLLGTRARRRIPPIEGEGDRPEDTQKKGVCVTRKERERNGRERKMEGTGWVLQGCARRGKKEETHGVWL